MTILLICFAYFSRSFMFKADWSIMLLGYHRLCLSRTIYWSICNLIKILGQQIHLTNYLQHFANKLSLELQVYIFLTRIQIIHSTHNFQLLHISLPYVTKFNIYPQPHLGIHLCAFDVYTLNKLISYQILFEKFILIINGIFVGK